MLVHADETGEIQVECLLVHYVPPPDSRLVATDMMIASGFCIAGGHEPLLPQQRNGTSPQVDLYSFGVVMWELWTGLEPYEGENYHALLHVMSADTEVRPPLPGGWVGGWASGCLGRGVRQSCAPCSFPR